MSDQTQKEPSTLWDFLPEGVTEIALDFRGATMGQNRDLQRIGLRQVSDTITIELRKEGILGLEGHFVTEGDPEDRYGEQALRLKIKKFPVDTVLPAVGGGDPAP